MEEEFSPIEFERDRHIIFVEMMNDLLPSEYQSHEINHFTLAYFTLSSLDILHALDRVDKEAVASWVLSFQVHPKSQDELSNGNFYGFVGSRYSEFSPVRKHSNFQESCLYVVPTDVEAVDFSYFKCLENLIKQKHFAVTDSIISKYFNRRVNRQE